jgi:hypothetical protein
MGASSMWMLRMTSRILGSLGLLSLLATGTHAQLIGGGGDVIFPGSTVQGDILRGEGSFLRGAGEFNYYSAVAGSINTDTWIRLNEYIYESARISSMRYAQRLADRIARDNEHHRKILDRHLNNPEQADVARGDALNALFKELTDPRITDSAFRLSPVHLSGDVIRTIPFFYGPASATISMQRLTARGQWPAGLRDAELAAERRAYERAIDNVLEQQIEGKLMPDSIAAVEVAVSNLFSGLDRERTPSSDKVYVEAKNYLRQLEDIKELIKRRAAEQILSDMDKYSGTTVHDLVKFMQRNNLRFSYSNIQDERQLYDRLYASLRQQLDLVQVPKEPAPNK